MTASMALASPIVSVVIPSYNLGRYLGEAVESVQKQTLRGVELVIVDDGSTDASTLSVLDEFARQDIRVIRQKNSGVSATLNHGIRETQGRYVCCLDADDRLCPSYLEKAAAVLESKPAVGFVTSFFRDFDGATTVDLVRFAGCGFPMILVGDQAMSASLFRREAWKQVGGYDQEMDGWQDWDFWIRVLEAGYSADVIREVLYEHRVRADSITATIRRQPKKYSHLLGTLARRHQTTYQRYFPEYIQLIGSRLARFYEYSRALGRSRAWLGEQSDNWQRESERQAAIVNELRTWIAELENTKAWLEQQRTNWQAKAERQQALVQELLARINELETNDREARK